MASNVETMFYVKEKPWHGQGQNVSVAPNSKDALKLAGLDWRVDQKKVFVDGYSVPQYKANVRSSDGKVLGIVSDKYKIVQNVDAFEFTDGLLSNGDIEVKYETAGSLASGKKVWMLMRMPTTTILGDSVEPYMVFTNTHDGSGAIKVAMTPIRVVCQNTLTLALSGAKRTWTTKHMGNMEQKMHEAQITLGLAKEYMDNLEEMADIMQQVKITDDDIKDFLNLAYPIPFGKTATERKIANAEYMRANFMNLYKNIGDIKKFGSNGWYMYNATSDFISHMQSLRKTSSLEENRFIDLVNGNKILDIAQQFVLKR